MARAHAIREAAIKRAVKGALAAGAKVARAEIHDDKIVLFFGEPAPAEPATDFDRWKAERDARQA